jgi:hypothetical protein
VSVEHGRQPRAHQRPIERWTGRVHQSATGAETTNVAFGGKTVSRGGHGSWPIGTVGVAISGGRAADGPVDRGVAT